jgi:hypothetical protein
MVNDELAELEPITRLLFIYLWMIADRDGRFEDKPKKIKAMTFPFDNIDCDKALTDLQNKGFLSRYQVNGNNYIQITNFLKHQCLSHQEKITKSNIPPIPINTGLIQDKNNTNALSITADVGHRTYDTGHMTQEGKGQNIQV